MAASLGHGTWVLEEHQLLKVLMTWVAFFSIVLKSYDVAHKDEVAVLPQEGSHLGLGSVEER